MIYKMIYESDPKQKDTNQLWQGISAYAKLKKDQKPGEAFGALR